MALFRRRRRSSCAALVGIALAALAAASVSEAAFPGSNGRIAVAANWPGCSSESGSRIATIRPDGTGFRELTECEGFSAPDWLPGGRRMLFVMNGQGQLGMMRSDGAHRRMLPLKRDFGLRPSISPDGRFLAYLRPTRNPDIYAPDALPEIWRAATDGTEDRQIGVGYSPRWSPDGRRIAFVGVGGLSVMDAGTGARVRVLMANIRSASSLDWSPDSRRLLFSTACCYSPLLAIRADGRGQARRLITDPAGSPRRLLGAVWSPDGKRIAYVWAFSSIETHTVEYSIWTATSRGKRAKRIYSSGYFDTDTFESLSGPQLSWGPRP